MCHNLYMSFFVGEEYICPLFSHAVNITELTQD
jgi:hypothetical protein